MRPISDRGVGTALTILITAGRIPVALDLARRFAARGHRVIACDSLPDFICRRSRAVAATYRIRAPATDPGGFREDILRVVERERVDLLVPGCEEMLHLASFRDDLPASCTPYFEPLERLYPLHHKLSFARRCEELGLPVPTTAPLGPGGELPPPLAGRDVVLKPALSRGGANVAFVDAGAPLPALAPLEEPNQWVAQARVRGRTLCAFAVAHEGRVLLEVIYEPVYTNGHIAVCFQPLAHPGVAAFTRQFLEAERLSGFVAFDFMEDERGGLWAIECNPRATSGVHLTDPTALVDAILEKRRPVGGAAQPAPLTMLGAGMFSALVDMIQERRPFSARAFAKTAARAKDALFDRRDPWPYLIQPLYVVKTMQTMKRENITLCDWSYWGLAWEGPGRRAALERAGLWPPAGAREETA